MSYVFVIGGDEICIDGWVYFCFVALNKKPLKSWNLQCYYAFRKDKSTFDVVLVDISKIKRKMTRISIILENLFLIWIEQEVSFEHKAPR